MKHFRLQVVKFPWWNKSNQSTIRYSSHSRKHSVPKKVCQSALMMSNTSITSQSSLLLQLLPAGCCTSWWFAAWTSYKPTSESDASGTNRKCFLSSQTSVRPGLVPDTSPSLNLKWPWWQGVRQDTTSLWEGVPRYIMGPLTNSSDTIHTYKSCSATGCLTASPDSQTKGLWVI